MTEGTGEPRAPEPQILEPQILQREVGPFQANCYVVVCPETREAVVIDPGAEPPAILGMVREAGSRVVAIVTTHGHIDHVGAAGAVREATGAPVMVHREDARLLASPFLSLAALIPGWGATRVKPDRELADGDRVTFGRLSLLVRHTPGHTPGGVCLVIEREPDAPSICFSGDTLFAGSVGRTDFPGGDWTILERSIREVVYALPDRTLVLPGHGPGTTVGEEKRGNAFVRG